MRFGSSGINQQSAFTAGPRLNTESAARVTMFCCGQESCICRESPSRPHKKLHYASLIKLNSPLPNTAAGLRGCIEPPRVCSQAVGLLQQLLYRRHCRLQQSKCNIMNREYWCPHISSAEQPSYGGVAGCMLQPPPPPMGPVNYRKTF